ncbi:hypothetical protein K490DRAFT_54015 [Saccharata proteae CBS 121410]|uniref:Uncharacterized protein n=1 Tax=Saccharata proteae CBS 121410 TaxID=1314787 RepID=A0A9P4I1N2_9PEZI|nr:hypothetical protein K490DRAFT_54015 [Saccharata proteae CBS 121410]
MAISICSIFVFLVTYSIFCSIFLDAILHRAKSTEQSPPATHHDKPKAPAHHPSSPHENLTSSNPTAHPIAISATVNPPPSQERSGYQGWEIIDSDNERADRRLRALEVLIEGFHRDNRVIVETLRRLEEGDKKRMERQGDGVALRPLFSFGHGPDVVQLASSKHMHEYKTPRA